MIDFVHVLEKEQPNIIDVRETDEYDAGHVPGAKNLPLSSLAENYDVLSRLEKYYLICQGGGRSARACSFLSALGYLVVNVEGGTKSWPAFLEH